MSAPRDSWWPAWPAFFTSLQKAVGDAVEGRARRRQCELCGAAVGEPCRTEGGAYRVAHVVRRAKVPHLMGAETA